MKIVLSGVETNNKGAELMLYAILQELERKYPDATVYLPPSSVRQGLDYIKSSVKLRYWPYGAIIEKSHINGVLRRLHLPLLNDTKAVLSDYFLDGSGFRFSDQCKLWGLKPEWWSSLLKRQYNHGSKIIFLPQAFGPFNEKDTQQAISILGRYSSLIIPREKVSYNYLQDSGLLDMGKVRIFPDFTSLVDGTFPTQYEHLRGGICIIPNMRMIDRGAISFDNYIKLLSAIIIEGETTNRPVYLLNHEGINDERLAYLCRDSVRGDINVVSGLNALEVKGLIASAYAVITSRFHGLASALNSGVPSLATSWSHKYAELFRDYDLEGYVLPIEDFGKAIETVRMILNEQDNYQLRIRLQRIVPQVKAQTRMMWAYIWSI